MGVCLRQRRPWRCLSLGARYVVEQRIPKIRDNMNVVTRLREYAKRYLKVGGTKRKSSLFEATLVGKLHHVFR
jgi:hypothetical protein